LARHHYSEREKALHLAVTPLRVESGLYMEQSMGYQRMIVSTDASIAYDDLAPVTAAPAIALLSSPGTFQFGLHLSGAFAYNTYQFADSVIITEAEPADQYISSKKVVELRAKTFQPLLGVNWNHRVRTNPVDIYVSIRGLLGKHYGYEYRSTMVSNTAIRHDIRDYGADDTYRRIGGALLITPSLKYLRLPLRAHAFGSIELSEKGTSPNRESLFREEYLPPSSTLNWYRNEQTDTSLTARLLLQPLHRLKVTSTDMIFRGKNFYGLRLQSASVGIFFQGKIVKEHLRQMVHDNEEPRESTSTYHIRNYRMSGSIVPEIFIRRSFSLSLPLRFEAERVQTGLNANNPGITTYTPSCALSLHASARLPGGAELFFTLSTGNYLFLSTTYQHYVMKCSLNLTRVILLPVMLTDSIPLCGN